MKMLGHGPLVDLIKAGKLVRRGKMTIALNKKTQEIEIKNSPEGDIACPLKSIDRAASDFLKWGREEKGQLEQSWTADDARALVQKLEELQRQAQSIYQAAGSLIGPPFGEPGSDAVSSVYVSAGTLINACRDGIKAISEKR